MSVFTAVGAVSGKSIFDIIGEAKEANTPAPAPEPTPEPEPVRVIPEEGMTRRTAPSYLWSPQPTPERDAAIADIQEQASSFTTAEPSMPALDRLKRRSERRAEWAENAKKAQERLTKVANKRR